MNHSPTDKRWSSPSSPGWAVWLGWPWLLAALLLAGTIALPGCSGCTQSQAAKKKAEEEEKKKKDKSKLKEKPNFEVARLVTSPDDPDEVQNHVKPGHWVTLTQQARANNFDFRAEFELASVDNNRNPFDVDRTPYQIVSSRPAALVKGQARHFEMTAYVPTAARSDAPAGGRKKVWFQSRLLSARGGNPLLEVPPEGTVEMKEFECFLLVLSRDVRSYLFLKTIDSARMPTNDQDTGFLTHYRVILPKIDERVPVPENALTWTGIAYVVWDDLNPKLFSPDQQQALLDWLHWGGQLIVSGPDSLDQLKGSFLDPYLPAQSEESIDLGAAALQEMNDFWSLPDEKRDPRRMEFVPNQPILGVRFKKHEAATDVTNTGGLVVERRIGGGRIVVTAFSLDDRQLLRWKSFDGFLNGALFRRPARDFSPLANLGNIDAKPLWVLPDNPYAPAAEQSNRSTRLVTTEPRLTSTLRYFSRDIGYRNTKIERAIKEQLDESTRPTGGTRTGLSTGATPPARVARQAPTGSTGADLVVGATEWIVEADESGGTTDSTSDANAVAAFDTVQRRRDFRTDSLDWRFGGYSASNLSGVAGWNDFSGAAHDVRQIVRDAAGIKIPTAAFVLRMIAIYLAVLVPLNWLVFRLLGRVEFAWIATPVIAIVGALLVIQQAQLDIGFLRSRREVAILETQGDYPRGHLTRYSLLYTYLGTAFDAVLADPNSLAQPFAKNTTYSRGTYERPRQVHYHRDSELKLTNFFVPSYSSEMVHSEQMFELGGALRLDGDDPDDWELVNGTKLSLEGAGILYCPPDGVPGQVRTAWLGQLKPGVSRPVRFTAHRAQDESTTMWPEWNESPVTSVRPEDADSGSTAGEVRLAGLLALASQKLLLFPGDVRLVAWMGDDLPGIEFAPVATQTTVRTIVVTHLRRGALPVAARDLNVRVDFKQPAAADDSAPDTPPPPTRQLPQL